MDGFQWELTVPSLVSLPPEVLLKIFSYLSPQDLLRLASLHSKLDKTAFDGSLWHNLHPVAWAKGQRKLSAPKQALSEVSVQAWLSRQREHFPYIQYIYSIVWRVIFVDQNIRGSAN